MMDAIMRVFFSGLILAILTLSTSQTVLAQTPEDQPTRFSLRTFSQYNENRLGYEALPVRILVGGGGKLGSREKFRLHASVIKNYTPKKVVAVRFTFFVFKFSDPDELVGVQQTDLMPLELAGFERRKVDLVIGYVEEIPLLAYKPGEEFHLEFAVTEVHYDDGSIWQATDLPQKRDLPKTP
jgi:hypothetical protein